MSFKPEPKQILYMLRLIFGPPEPKLKDVSLEPVALRKRLETEGLIRLEKRSGRNHVLVTDKGWQWTQTHLHVPFNPQGINPGRVLLGLLPRLQRFLDHKGCGLAELFEPTDASSSEPAARRAHAALLALGGGKTRQRLTLAQARAALPDLSAESFDRALLQLQQDGSVALYHEDNPDQRSSDLEAAAIRIAGSRYHLVYLLK
jgi:hypothetical protein